MLRKEVFFSHSLLKTSFRRTWQKNTHNLSAAGYSFFCGEKGIRTPGAREEHNGFRDRPVRPLRHLSLAAKIVLLGELLTK
jgi:hypothetical protein